MSLNFIPDYRFDKFNDVSPQFLVSLGIKGVILDIDNTLEPYEHPLPGEHVISWLTALSEVGIKTAIVSNNNWERVVKFNDKIGMPAYAKGKKPFKKNLLRAMKDMCTARENTILMGDQVFTDVWAAHNAGIKAILVPPIKDKTDPFTKFKRLLEKPFLRRYERKNRK
jgi:HAD superfamily phosphatase (TIGR01668 family)